MMSIELRNVVKLLWLKFKLSYVLDATL